MAKVYKATIYLTDTNEEIVDLDHLKQRIEDRMGRWVGVHIAEMRESEEFEWHDDININKISADTDDFEAYLKEENE